MSQITGQGECVQKLFLSITASGEIMKYFCYPYRCLLYCLYCDKQEHLYNSLSIIFGLFLSQIIGQFISNNQFLHYKMPPIYIWVCAKNIITNNKSSSSSLIFHPEDSYVNG